jgi:hypothetical protein
VLLACLVVAGPAAAQEEQALTAPAALHTEPDGVPLVTLPAGAEVETGRARGDWHQATVDGWIFTNSTEPTRRQGFDLVVTHDEGENLRSAPNGPVVGRAREGTLLERVSEKGGWTHVRRAGWIPKKAIAPAKAAPRSRTRAAAQVQQPAPSATRPAGRAAPPPPQATPAPAAEPAGADRLQTARETALGSTPGGSPIGTLQSGAPARVVAHAGDWVKVQVEGWVPADAVTGSDAGALVGVSADELHAQPDRFVGQTLEWRLQLIAVKRADELRAEMPAGTPYLLTRGPLPEPGFVYVSIPPDRVAEFEALPPLHELVVRATVKAARTKFLTTPVVDLVSVVSGMDGKSVAR